MALRVICYRVSGYCLSVDVRIDPDSDHDRKAA
jgi:hypothetical protein